MLYGVAALSVSNGPERLGRMTRNRKIGLSLLERLPLGRERRWPAYGFALLSSLIAVVVRWEIDSVLPPGFPFLTFFPAVILTAFLFGLGPGIVAAVLSGLAAWYWFVPPVGFGIAYDSAIALGFYCLIVGVDIALVHWMQRATAYLAQERRLSAALAETRQDLFHELQHRVGNNLQMVASLLSLQGRGLSQPEALAALSDASRRVAMIGRIQRTLYSPEGEQLALAPYLETIVRDTIEAAGRDHIKLTFHSALGDALVEPATAIPSALAVAEAISNALEHGFSESGGDLVVALREEAGGYVMTVTDDGSGLPQDFVLAGADTLGLRMARSLAASQGGSFELGPRADRAGSIATITIAKARRN